MNDNENKCLAHYNLSYDISAIRPFINWLYFLHAWGLSGKPQEEKDKMKAEAERMLDSLEGRYHTRALFSLFVANSDGDDIIVGDTRFPMLRQQHPSENGGPNLSLADFIRPVASGIEDRLGVFATTVDSALEHDFLADDFQRMLAQTLADRLAEATTEVLHRDVRRRYWGYAPDEQLSVREMLREDFQGIRPAVGYPSLPDTSANFIIDRLLSLGQIGIRLTESGAMKPHASVSGLMFAHPKAHYFDLGKIGDDQLHDYARRRGLPVELVRRFLAVRLQ